MLGTPGSRQVLMVFEDQTTLSFHSLSGGVNRKWIDGFVAALRRGTAATDRSPEKTG